MDYEEFDKKNYSYRLFQLVFQIHCFLISLKEKKVIVFFIFFKTTRLRN